MITLLFSVMADEDAVRDDRRNTETDASAFQTDDLQVGNTSHILR